MTNHDRQFEEPNKKRKQNSQDRVRIIADSTLRNFPFFYYRVSLVSHKLPSTEAALDALTVKKHFTEAMTQRFGVVGSAITMDILKLENGDAWIRVPFDDRAIVTEALSGWATEGLAWKIKASGSWLGGFSTRNGSNLFDD